MNILNIVNFIRSIEPRMSERDLLLPVKKQYELIKKYNFPATFLFQHDALFDSRFTDLIKPSDKIEIGIWLELNKSLVERAGGKWNGRDGYFWDWHSDAGLTIGYLPEVRFKVIDIAMEDFKKTFGFYPKTVASWSIDAPTLKYMEEKYHIDASMNCKDQWGTDGYSMWGGYYNQAFYPSLNNSFCPAGSEIEQINVPIFRMLGSDPVDQYYCKSGDNGQDVISLEPVYPESGGSLSWVKWFFGECFNGKSLSFGYAQAGQENSFGWDRMGDGYIMQMEYIDSIRKDKSFELMTVSEAGRYYKENYTLTPPSSFVSYKEDKTSIWFSNRFYRANVYGEGSIFFIRDLFLFDDNYKERYLDCVCDNMNMYYDNLPVIDSFRTSNFPKRDGGYFYNGEKRVTATGKIETDETENKELIVYIPTESEKIKLVFGEDQIEIFTLFSLRLECEKDIFTVSVKEDGVKLSYNGYTYFLGAFCSEIRNKEKCIEFIPKNGKIVLKTHVK